VLVLEPASLMTGDESKAGCPVRLLVHVGKASGAQGMEETLVADGSSPEPGLLLNHVCGSHDVPVLGEFGLNSLSSGRVCPR
jgi:hypothetical protein